MRTQPGQHLSQAGVGLARRVGKTMGRFDRVAASTLPRAYETARGSGWPVAVSRGPQVDIRAICL